MSEIEWTDLTQNPIKEEGGGHYCIPITTGCKNCFASALNSRGTRFGGNGRKFGVRPEGHPKMMLNINMLRKWGRMRKSKKIFVGSMTDIFGNWVNDDLLDEMFDAMREASKQTFQILTKRPERMPHFVAQWLAWNGLDYLPSNIWLGTSAEDQQRFNERLGWLLKTRAQVRFLSLEPLLAPIKLGFGTKVDWIIVGGESGPEARPLDLAWVEDILAQCQAANIPAFVKQLGSRWAKQIGAAHKKGGNPDEWPAELRVRMFSGEMW